MDCRGGKALDEKVSVRDSSSNVMIGEQDEEVGREGEDEEEEKGLERENMRVLVSPARTYFPPLLILSRYPLGPIRLALT